MKAIVLQPVPPAKPGIIYYPLQSITLPIPTPGPNQVLLRLLSASLNHRDLFQRRGLYPGTTPSIPLLADACAILLSPPTHPLLNKRVVINPTRGWLSSPRGPEPGSPPLSILGGTKHYPTGTLQEYGVYDAAEVVEAPAHLSADEVAALPVCGVTAWRAVVSKAQVERGMNVLVTGIGGGVALFALQLAVAKGARVYVTSSSAEKVERAKTLGAAGGVLYTSEKWEKELAEMLPAERPYLDAVIDGAGGDIVARVLRVVADGGKIVSYGMTLGPSMPFGMGAVLRNVELLGSTMGSRKEFFEMVAFVKETGLRPVISRVVEGMEVDKLEGLWEDMEKGRQFGKLVVRISREDSGELERGKL